MILHIFPYERMIHKIHPELGEAWETIEVDINWLQALIKNGATQNYFSKKINNTYRRQQNKMNVG